VFLLGRVQEAALIPNHDGLQNTRLLTHDIGRWWNRGLCSITISKATEWTWPPDWLVPRLLGPVPLMARQRPWRLALGVLFFLLVATSFVAGDNHGEDHHKTTASSNYNDIHPAERPDTLVSQAQFALNKISIDRRSRRKSPSAPDHHAQRFHVSPKVVEAARLLAESTPQVPTGNHSEVVDAARRKFPRHANPAASDNTNNTPQQHLQTPKGRLGASSQEGNYAGGGYWMVDMASHGASPLTTPGYQVGGS